MIMAKQNNRTKKKQEKKKELQAWEQGTAIMVSGVMVNTHDLFLLGLKVFKGIRKYNRVVTLSQLKRMSMKKLADQL